MAPAPPRRPASPGCSSRVARCAIRKCSPPPTRPAWRWYLPVFATSVTEGTRPFAQLAPRQAKGPRGNEAGVTNRTAGFASRQLDCGGRRLRIHDTCAMTVSTSPKGGTMKLASSLLAAASLLVAGTSYAALSAGDQYNLDQIRSGRSAEHTSELQSLMRTSYAVLCFKK